MLAYGVLESTYNPNLNVKEGIELATKAITTAINRDLATGDGLDIFVIDEKGAHQVVAKKVEKILK